MQIAGQHVVVTGASRGIGESIARQAAKHGALVTLVARNEIAIASLARELGGHAVAADLGEASQRNRLIERCEAVAGRPVDILVNNAGVEVTKPYGQQTEHDVTNSVALNLLAPMELTRQVLPGMLARNHGRIVNVSSMASAGGYPGMATYCATKSGLSHFTRVLRQDLKGTDVGLTALEIGPVPTDMLDSVEHYGPAARCFRRLRRLHLMPNVDRERVAKAAVRGISLDRNFVWLPMRAAVFPFLSALPQRIVEVFMYNIKPDTY
jgi:short-subunit dehydrogenase